MDELTRVIAEALGCEPDATDDKQGYACREHGDTSTAAWPCPVLTEIDAALAPLIVARVREARAAAEAAALEAAAEAWSDWDALNAPEDWLRERAGEVRRRNA